MKRTSTAFGIYGTKQDKRPKDGDDQGWRPTINLCTHKDLPINRLELIVLQKRHLKDAEKLKKDLFVAAPATEVTIHLLSIRNPWDLAQVYSELADFVAEYSFEDDTDYYFHMTTGTTAVKISVFQLVERGYFSGKLIQTQREPQVLDRQVIDLRLERYKSIARRLQANEDAAKADLGEGIETRSKLYEDMMAEIVKVSVRSKEPILLTGATGVGKTRIAKRIHGVKDKAGKINGQFVPVNCATLRGDLAKSALFGHVKGAFTGATEDRQGYLAEADNGLLFLDEVGELGLEEQKMLLTAIETGEFRQEGSNDEQKSHFHLISGTNTDLYQAVRDGKFRADLFARINIWHFELPSLGERLEDIEPNLDFELEKQNKETDLPVDFSKAARKRFIDFASSPSAAWTANFRDFKAAIARLRTLATRGRIGTQNVDTEIMRLQKHWENLEGAKVSDPAPNSLLVLGEAKVRTLDPFELAQLEYVLEVCRRPKILTLADAGRFLFSKSRTQKTSTNDSKRVSEYLKRFDLNWQTVQNRT